MKYTLDTIPVLDAYKTGCECPLCQLRIACEDSYVDSMLGAAYMEPDCRVRTNEVGFCTRHFQLMYDRRNRLGLARGAPFVAAARADDDRAARALGQIDVNRRAAGGGKRFRKCHSTTPSLKIEISRKPFSSAWVRRPEATSMT